VLRVDDVRVRADEVDRVAGWIGGLYPEYTPNHRRRLALAEVVLPRAALEADRPGPRADALAACRRAAEGDLDARDAAAWAELGGLLERRAGDHASLGLALWGEAHELPLDRWAGPLETPGEFLLVRPDRRLGPSSEAGAEALDLTVVAFPYVDRAAGVAALDAAVERARLRIVDPAWDAIVPESWKYRMRGGR